MLLPSSLKVGFNTLTKKQEGKERLIGGLNKKKFISAEQHCLKFFDLFDCFLSMNQIF